MIAIIITAAIGMTLIITKSFLFENIRECKLIKSNEYSYTLAHCPQCLGFWCGLICSLLAGEYIMCIAIAFTASFICEMIEQLIYER